MNKSAASARYIAAARKAGLTISEMNKDTWALITDHGEAFADGQTFEISKEARVQAAEYLANGGKV